MSYTTYKFQAYTRQAKKTGKCPTCDKRVTRSRTFEQAQNPFNKNPDGEMKSIREIYRELDAQAEAWVPDFEHDKCREARADNGRLAS